MSLKAFHVVFIFATLAMAGVVGWWAWNDYGVTPSTETLLLGIGAAVLGLATIPYGIWFIRKLRTVSYL